MVDLPAPDRPVNHSTLGFCEFCRARETPVDVDGLPMDVLRTAQREIKHAGTDGAVSQSVDQDESAQRRILRIGIERNRQIKLELADANVVEFQALGRLLLERIDIDLVLQRRHRRRYRARADFHQVGAALQHRLVVHPHHGGAELAGDLRRRIACRDDVAPAHVQLTI